jgi:hypothetical protein
MAAVHTWGLESDTTLVVLDGGKSCSDLMRHEDRLRLEPGFMQTGLEVIEFHEPDLDNEITALAIQPGKVQAWVLKLPLIFSKEVK